jgi:hypothetical protein
VKRKKCIRVAVAAALLAALGLYILRFSAISYAILRHSAQQGYYPIAAVQLALGVKPDGPARTALVESIYNNHPAMAELLVRYGANIERQWMSGEPSGPPLAWALMFGESDIAKMLLRHGARADYQPLHGTNTALHMAVELNDPSLVRLLIRRGADPNMSDYSEVTPLMLAVAYNRPKIAGILRDAGAKSSQKRLVGAPERYCVFVRDRAAPAKRR